MRYPLALLLIDGSNHPHVSPACARAVAAQNAYVNWAVNVEGYPNVPIEQGMKIQAADLALLDKMRKADCADDTTIRVLPG